MEFNQDKCTVMHFGKSNSGVNYTGNGRTLRGIDIQKALGIQVHRSLKVSTPVYKVVKKADRLPSSAGASKKKLVVRRPDTGLQNYEIEWIVKDFSTGGEVNYKRARVQ
eukprot:g27585.t1